MTPPILEIAGIATAYGGKTVVDDLTFTLERGQIGCLLGESGCGKTTALRSIAGFEAVRAGRISIDGRVVSRPGWRVPPEARRLGMVFQDYALFPHLTVRKNVSFGLHRLPRAEQDARSAALLELVGLSGDAGRFPHELSGGQQQRVALARALAPGPDLLLLDEPFSNLDVALRERLSAEVRDILKEFGTSALMVTHNQHEAFAMADAIGVMENGRLEQWDTAYNLYHRPKSPYVADFVGEGVLIRGTVTSADEVRTAIGTLRGRFSFPCRDGCPADVLIRPEDVVCDEESPVQGEILRKDFRGASILYTLRLGNGERLLTTSSSHRNLGVGLRIGIRPQVDDIVLFEAGGG